MTNERLTPETDAAWQANRDTVYRVETSRKLERERDEAREKWKEQHEALRTLAEHGENEIQKLLKELTETRNKMADALQEVDLRTLDFERMKEERDDALSQIYQAECRAERFCQERDEAIKRYEEISRVFEGANEEEWKPCTTLGETVARILKERDEARQPNKELHSTDPMWQKPLSTNNPIPYTTSP